MVLINLIIFTMEFPLNSAWGFIFHSTQGIRAWDVSNSMLPNTMGREGEYAAETENRLWYQNLHFLLHITRMPAFIGIYTLC